MRTSINRVLSLGLLLVGAATDAFAQGTIYFYTYNTDTSFGQVFLKPGTDPVPSSYVGQLWYNDVGPTAPFIAIDSPISFAADNSGYIYDGTLALPSNPPGTTIWYMLRVWNEEAGFSWETAIHSGNLTQYGQSSVASTILGGIDSDDNIFPTRQANDFLTFQLLYGDEALPEPNTVTLFGVGVLLLGWRLSRKTRQ